MKNSIDIIFRKCIAALESELDFYIQDKNDDEEEGVQCCRPLTWRRGFHDREITAEKLNLVKDLLYTVQQIGSDFEREIKGLFQEKFKGEDDLLATVSYKYTCKGFGRLKACLQLADDKAAELIEGRLARSGRLGETLKRCHKVYNKNWGDTKDRIVITSIFHGRIFDKGMEQQVVMNKFDTDCEAEGKVFAKLLSCPKEIDQTVLTTPAFSGPPPYEANNFLVAAEEEVVTLTMKPASN